MELRLLTPLFYAQNKHLQEALDINSGFIKQRGYGILIVIYRNLRFGLPLRSHITHKNCFITKGVKGLDYTKAVLLPNDAYIDRQAFKIPEDEYARIQEHEPLIKAQFEKYIETYRKSVEIDSKRLLSRYRFSTLKNYHREFNIE